MSRFVRLNMNPELNDDQDCTIRAICLLLDKSWDEVFLEVCAEGFNIKRMPSSDITWNSYLTKEGWWPTAVSERYESGTEHTHAM